MSDEDRSLGTGPASVLHGGIALYMRHPSLHWLLYITYARFGRLHGYHILQSLISH